MAAAVSGKVWLFTLGQPGGATPGGARVAEIGPVPAFTAGFGSAIEFYFIWTINALWP